LIVGGVVAIGFDPTGKYVLVVSHSGQGEYDTQSWKLVARAPEFECSNADEEEGIGPRAGQTASDKLGLRVYGVVCGRHDLRDFERQMNDQQIDSRLNRLRQKAGDA